jgi:GxxExxY protein
MSTEPHKENVLALCDVIRETSYAIYKYLRSGHREQIYENALAHRLTKLGIIVEQQRELRVYDEDGTLLGHLRADLLIENKLICEIKGVRGLVDEHVAQLRFANQLWRTQVGNQKIYCELSLTMEWFCPGW